MHTGKTIYVTLWSVLYYLFTGYGIRKDDKLLPFDEANKMKLVVK